MNLFEDLGTAQGQKKLDALKAKYPKYDHGYITQASIPDRKIFKEWIESSWLKFKPYADKQFAKDFRLADKFSPRCWELYLGVTFLDIGFRLGQHNNAGPDFDLQSDDNKRLAWVEAVTPSKGTGEDKVPTIAYDGEAWDLPEKQLLLRITTALSDKFNKYKRELIKQAVGENEPFAIAINTSEFNHLDTIHPRILDVLFSIGHPVLQLDRMTGAVKDRYWQYRPNVTKSNKSDVSMNFFDDETHSGISAVIYCNAHLINSPLVPNEVGDNFVIVHNPLARNPLPVGFFSFGQEWIKESNGNVVRIR